VHGVAQAPTNPTRCGAGLDEATDGWIYGGAPRVQTSPPAWRRVRSPEQLSKVAQGRGLLEGRLPESPCSTRPSAQRPNVSVGLGPGRARRASRRLAPPPPTRSEAPTRSTSASSRSDGCQSVRRSGGASFSSASTEADRKVPL
jgi:hypothetical protein